MTSLSIKELTNGLVHIHENAASANVGYAAVVIQCGSRDEKKGEEGLAHFLEHCLFKGTVRRRAHHIINRLETVGAEIDAYTTKEYTCIYTVFMNAYLDRALDLMSDILFHSQFPAKEIEREKNVVLDEIQSYQDNPSEQIFEDFEKLVFVNHPLSGGILGEEASVSAFTRKQVSDFHRKHYQASNMILSTSVNEKENKVHRLVHKYFGSQESQNKDSRVFGEHRWESFDRTEKRQTYQSHYMTGHKAYDIHHEKREAFNFLNNILGGQSMNSRLNIIVREKLGLAYHVESGFSPYSDTGLFYIYLGCDKKNIQKVQKIIERELKSLKEKKLSPVQLSNARRQFQGQVSIAMESRANRVMQRARSMMSLGRVESLDEILKSIESVTAAEVQETANEVFELNNFSRLIYQNT